MSACCSHDPPEVDELQVIASMPPFPGEASMINSAIHDEERFWTKAVIVALSRFEVPRAFELADDSLSLYRQLWTPQDDEVHLTMAASEAGHQVHWAGDASCVEEQRSQRSRSAREVWSASFMRLWADGGDILASVRSADEALALYAETLGVSKTSLMAHCPEDARAHWRLSWEVRHGGRI